MDIHTPLEVPKPVQVSLSFEELEEIRIMAEEIFPCPVRNKQGRSYQKVYNDTKRGKLLEYGMERQGATLNPKKFDPKDPDSHNWDADWKFWRAEIKDTDYNDSTDLPENYKEKKWVMCAPWIAEKILKNHRMYPGCVDIVIFGKSKKVSENVYDVSYEATVPFENIQYKLREGKRYYENNKIYNKKTGEFLGYRWMVIPTKEPGYYASIYS